MTRSLVITDYKCTRLLGFSQTNQWWADFRTFINNPSAWELQWASGASIDHFADPADAVWSAAVLDAVGLPVDRVVLNVSGDYISDVSYWVTQIGLSVDNIRAKFPAVRMILLQANVAGPGGALCQNADSISNPSAVDDTVRTCWTNRYIRSAIASVSRGNVRGGAWVDANNCATDFDDYIGHLNSGIITAVGQKAADYYDVNL